MNGLKLIYAERRRQIVEKGYTIEHDLLCRQNLQIAAHCYVLAEELQNKCPPEWPWEGSYWKPSDPIRNLTKAGALYMAAAEVELQSTDTLGIYLLSYKANMVLTQRCAETINRKLIQFGEIL